jgi:50S ribosomal subunit-associated GTPase HflX
MGKGRGEMRYNKWKQTLEKRLEELTKQLDKVQSARNKYTLKELIVLNKRLLSSLLE